MDHSVIVVGKPIHMPQVTGVVVEEAPVIVQSPEISRRRPEEFQNDAECSSSTARNGVALFVFVLMVIIAIVVAINKRRRDEEQEYKQDSEYYSSYDAWRHNHY
jgi:hypothetical protein